MSNRRKAIVRLTLNKTPYNFVPVFLVLLENGISTLVCVNMSRTLIFIAFLGLKYHVFNTTSSKYGVEVAILHFADF